MKILALDIARRCGWALGEAGEPPAYGVEILRKPKDELVVGSNHLGLWLLAQVQDPDTRPDLVVYEKPLDIVAKWSMAQRAGYRVQNPESIEAPLLTKAVVHLICATYGIEVKSFDRQEILVGFTGTGRYGTGDEGRRKGKLAVVRWAQVNKLIPRDCQDDDIADACAIHWVASSVHGRKPPKVLHLFGETIS